MSGELIKVDDLNLTPSKYSDNDFDKTASGGGGFLPRIQLLTSNSQQCKSGEFPINHYAAVDGQTYNDLGKNVDVLIVDWRPKALEVGENVISVFDPNDAEFQRIQEKSAEADSGCMYGPEFLVYVPSMKGFGTFFMGTKSARREAGNVKSKMHKAATLGSQKIETSKYSWFAPKVSACSTPFDPPSGEELSEVIEKFRNPPKNEVEKVTEEERAR